MDNGFRTRTGWHYPPGCETDPRAPSNQKENPCEALEEALGTVRHFQDLMNTIMDMIGQVEFQKRFNLSHSGLTVDFNHYMDRLEQAIMKACWQAEEGEL